MGSEVFAPVLKRISNNVEQSKNSTDLPMVEGLKKSVQDFEKLLSPGLMQDLIGIFLESTASTHRLRRKLQKKDSTENNA